MLWTHKKYANENKALLLSPGQLHCSAMNDRFNKIEKMLLLSFSTTSLIIN